MKLSWRAVLCALVMVGATGAFKGCKSGPSSGGEDPPVTADDKIVVTGTGTTALNVLSNDTNLTHEPLTYTIDEGPSVGSASFNSDHTVALTLPSGFKGMTKFKYKITNSVGGFSISSAVVFVDVPAYRALFAAKNATTSAYELYVSDFISSAKISDAAVGNFRLQGMWHSKSGSLIVYERGDPAQLTSTAELYFVKPTGTVSPVKFPAVSGRVVVSGGPVVISDDSRWIAYPTNPSAASGQAVNLYVLDSSNSGTAKLVGLSTGTLTALTQWAGATNPNLYFMAPAGSGYALYRAGVSSLDSPERISPIYPSTDQQQQVLVSPDETRVVIFGTHAGVTGAFFVDPTTPNIEQRLTTDMTAGTSIASFRTDESVSRLIYLARATGSATGRLSVVDVGANETPQTVFDGNIVGLSDLRPDGLAALITRGSNGAGSDGTLYEVTLDRSAADALVASNVTGGLYADADHVYLYSRTLTPSVIQRSDFERAPTALVKSNTPAGALFSAPLFETSAVIIEDTTSGAGVVHVNATAPGKTLKLTDLSIGSPPATLAPTFIAAQ
jgi:Bacterial Ig domain